MCRLFGFRSAILSQVHSSLLSAENALVEQSLKHPDGWGLAYYLGGAPHLVKSVQSAVKDSLFHRLSGIVSSQTVLAHLRKATIGDLNITNTHPFQYGRWVFAHNGNFKDFDNKRSELEAELPAELQKFVLGSTDSEMFFYLILAQIGLEKVLSHKSIKSTSIVKAVKQALALVHQKIGAEHNDTNGPANENYYTFILTNGRTMVGYNGGKSLYYSTYKTSCPDRGSCPAYAPFCEAPPTDGEVRHLVLSSEPLGEPNIWIPVAQGEIVGVDANMTFFSE